MFIKGYEELYIKDGEKIDKKMKIKMEVKLKRVLLREKFECLSLKILKIGVFCLCYNLVNYKFIYLWKGLVLYSYFFLFWLLFFVKIIL